MRRAERLGLWLAVLLIASQTPAVAETPGRIEAAVRAYLVRVGLLDAGGAPAASDLAAVLAEGNSAAGPIVLGDGTAAAPSFAFADDPDCGIYRAGANRVGFASELRLSSGSYVAPHASDGNWSEVFGGMAFKGIKYSDNSPPYTFPVWQVVSNRMDMANFMALHWWNETYVGHPTGAADSGLRRDAAGVVAVTDGSTGYGRLRLSASSDLVSGSGDPEGAVTAGPGSLYLRTDGTIYRKGSGTGNTGWVALGDA